MLNFRSIESKEVECPEVSREKSPQWFIHSVQAWCGAPDWPTEARGRLDRSSQWRFLVRTQIHPQHLPSPFTLLVCLNIDGSQPGEESWRPPRSLPSGCRYLSGLAGKLMVDLLAPSMGAAGRGDCPGRKAIVPMGMIWPHWAALAVSRASPQETRAGKRDHWERTHVKPVLQLLIKLQVLLVIVGCRPRARHAFFVSLKLRVSGSGLLWPAQRGDLCCGKCCTQFPLIFHRRQHKHPKILSTTWSSRHINSKFASALHWNTYSIFMQIPPSKRSQRQGGGAGGSQGSTTLARRTWGGRRCQIHT